MLLALQILPLALYLLVSFHLYIGLAPLEAVLLIDGDEVVEEQGIGTLLLIFRQDAYQHQVDTLRLMELQGAQTVPPAERPQATVLTFLQGARHIGDGDTHANHVMVGGVPVFYQTEQVHVEHGEIHLQVLVNLALGHLRVAIEVAKGLVDHIEHLTTNLFLAKHLTALGVNGVQVVALHHHLRDLAELLRHALFRYEDAILHIVVVLLEATQLLDVLGVVGIVVDGSHGAQLIETLDEHSLGIHIGEAQRTDHLGHAFLTSPLLYSLEQG